MEDKKVPDSLVDVAYRNIYDKIYNFELCPGQMISDFALSKELGVSRTPIRQALQRLENDGLIYDEGAGKGYKVCEITLEDIEDLLDAREALETAALRLATQKHYLPENIQVLIKSNELLKAVDGKVRVSEQFANNQRFHEQIVQLSHNTRLIKFNKSLMIQMTRIRVLSFLEHLDPGNPDGAFKSHQELIQYIVDGENDKAVRFLSNHIVSVKRTYEKMLEDQISWNSYGVLQYLMKNI